MKDPKTFVQQASETVPSWRSSAAMIDRNAAVLAEYAEFEDKRIKEAYPWLLRPLVRWVRRATKF